MGATPTTQFTPLLDRWRAGEVGARDELMAVVYTELRDLAAHMMRSERGNHTLQATALVHEVYLRMIGDHPRWAGRGHFFAVAAQVMRRVLIDHARRRRYAKRGGGQTILSLDETAVVADETAAELVALDDALNELEKLDPRLRKLVELRFFGGMTIAETATVLEISPATAKREWRTAKAWLYATLQPVSRS